MPDTPTLLERIRTLEHDLAECRESLYAARVVAPGQPERLITMTGWARSLGISRARAYQLRQKPDFPPVLLIRSGFTYYGLESLNWWNAKRLQKRRPKSKTG